MITDELYRHYGLLAVLTPPALAWYLSRAKRLMQLIGSRLNRFRSWLRRRGRKILRWVLAGGDE
jgi:hypothetical protein